MAADANKHPQTVCEDSMKSMVSIGVRDVLDNTRFFVVLLNRISCWKRKKIETPFVFIYRLDYVGVHVRAVALNNSLCTIKGLSPASSCLSYSAKPRLIGHINRLSRLAERNDNRPTCLE